MEHPRCEQPMCTLRGERVRKPVAARREHVARELGETAATQPPKRLQTQPEPVARPELGPEHAEREVSVWEEARQHPPPGVPVTGGVAVELGGVRVSVAQQEGGLA